MTSFVSDDPRIDSDEGHAKGSAPAGAVEWRATVKGLWVGRSGDRHMGTIEQGRAYAVTDADGRRRGTYPSLDAAMASAFAGEPEPEVDEPETAADVAPAWEGVALATTIIGAATVLLAAYALTLL